MFEGREGSVCLGDDCMSGVSDSDGELGSWSGDVGDETELKSVKLLL